MENKAAKANLALQALLGSNAYYHLTDFLVLDSLKSFLEPMLEEDYDPFAPPDEKARDIATLFRVIELYTTKADYKAYVESLKEKTNA